MQSCWGRRGGGGVFTVGFHRVLPPRDQGVLQGLGSREWLPTPVSRVPCPGAGFLPGRARPQRRVPAPGPGLPALPRRPPRPGGVELPRPSLQGQWGQDGRWVGNVLSGLIHGRIEPFLAGPWARPAPGSTRSGTEGRAAHFLRLSLSPGSGFEHAVSLLTLPTTPILLLLEASHQGPPTLGGGLWG